MSSVTMSDGRAVKFGEKQKCKREKIRDSAGNLLGVRGNFRNGKFLTIMLDELGEVMKVELCGHGVIQKGFDEGADADSPEVYYQAVKAIFERMRDGTAFDRVAGERQRNQDLIAALVEFHGITEEEASSFLEDELDAAEIKALRSIPEIKTILERNAAKGISQEAVNAANEKLRSKFQKSA